MSAAITRLVNTMSVLLLVMGVGCESPTRESHLPPPSSAEYLLSGAVQDTAYRYIPDVRIQVVEGTQVGVSTMTDASGRFELPGTFTGVVVVRAEKAGYVSMSRRAGTTVPSAGGRQILFFDMELDAPSVNLTGDWNLTLRADGPCAAVPDGLRTRTYTASLAPLLLKRQNYGGRLSGAAFWFSRTDVYISVAGTYASFYIDDPWSGYYVLEKLEPSGYLAIWGGGEGSVSESMVSGSFRGSFEYCASSDSNLKCEVKPVLCEASALTLVRR